MIDALKKVELLTALIRKTQKNGLKWDFIGNQTYETEIGPSSLTLRPRTLTIITDDAPSVEVRANDARIAEGLTDLYEAIQLSYNQREDVIVDTLLKILKEEPK